MHTPHTAAAGRSLRRALILTAAIAAAPAPAHAAVRIGFQDQRASVLPDEAPFAMAAASAIHARSMRLIVLWSRVQPDSSTRWDWDQYDDAVNQALARGFAVQLVLGGVGDNPPAWAGSKWRLMDHQAFSVFVAQAAIRYAGRVKLWSVLNEVDLTGYPAARYAATYSRSRRLIRRNAPGSRVLWGEFSPHIPTTYTRRALKHKKRVIADGFALHPYGHESAPRQGGLSRLGQVVHAVRRQTKLRTQDGHSLPVYATEFGCQTRVQTEAACADLWRTALVYSQRYRVRQLVAYQLLPWNVEGWDTSLVHRDGTPSLAMKVINGLGA
jgi:hypothetical protein